MYSKVILALCFVFCTTAHAHEMTPAYPQLKSSYIEGVSSAKMKLFNRRNDVSYYLIEVFTSDFKPIPFASSSISTVSSKIIMVGYNKSKIFDVYIRSSDIDRAVYICTQSKLLKQTDQISLITSRVCSKIKDK